MSVRDILIIKLSFILISEVFAQYPDASMWNVLYEGCDGSRQSPINIETSKAIHHGYEQPLNTSEHYHKIHKDFFRGNMYTRDDIRASGGPIYPHHYRLGAVHFHWGQGLNDGTEHTIDGEKLAMEIHIIHVNAKYEDIETAQNNTDGLMVVAIMVKISAATETRESGNPRLKRLLRNLMSNDENGESTMDLSDLYPSGMANGFDYWTYEGGLTTPHCQEVVTWIIVSYPLWITLDQLKVIQTLTPMNGNEITRPVQPLNGRRVKIVRGF